MAIALSKEFSVVYINPPLRRIQVIEDKNRIQNIDQINENLRVLDTGIVLESLNFIKLPYLFDMVNRWNGKRFARWIIHFLSKEKWEQVVFINDNDVYNGRYLAEFLYPKPLMVYYMRDNLSALDFWKRNVPRLEPALRSSYDLVLTNSVYYKEISLQDNPRSAYIGQGCDLEHFTKPIVSQEILPAKTKPRIGYTGALVSSRLDINLIRFLATQFPDWEFVLAGPEDEIFRLANLAQIPNVILPGAVPYEMVAAVNASFDVCINPQLINEMTLGNYPRKIDEFLALGKPVVATHTLAMEEFSPVCYLAKDYDQFASLIQKALDEDHETLQSQRKAFAQSHSWEACIAKLTEEVQKSLL